MWYKKIIKSVIMLMLLFIWAYCYKIIMDMIIRSEPYKVSEIIVHLYLGIFGIIPGILIGLDHFLVTKKMKGSWHFNIPRFVILGLPFLLLGLIDIISPRCLGYIYVDTYSFLINYISQMHVIIFFIFGYIFITSFDKKEAIQEQSKIRRKRQLTKIALYFITLIFIILLMYIFVYYFNSPLFNPYNIYLFCFAISTLFGLIIGTENFVHEIFKNGKWTFDIFKFLIPGLPILFSREKYNILLEILIIFLI